MKCRCIKKCFHKKKLYEVGDFLKEDVKDAKSIPAFFVDAKDFKAPKAKVHNDPKTFHEIQNPKGKSANDNVLE